MEKRPQKLSIKQWAEDDQPREKLLNKGKTSLSDAELLAIIIGGGNAEETAVDISKRILSHAGNNLYTLGHYSLKDFMSFRGIGEARAAGIIAAIELGRRRSESEVPNKPVIKSSIEAAEIVRPMLSDLDHEQFWVLMLNQRNQVLGKLQISKGGVTGTIADSRLIFKYALEHLATSIVLCHNHPSGNRKPSEADISLTRKLKEAGTLFDITILDHIIIAAKDYFSFADEGIL